MSLVNPSGQVVTDETHDLANWPVMRWVSEDLLHRIHMFYGYNHNALLLMRDELRVYALGENSHGCLGLGHTYPVTTPTEVVELRGKDVVQCASGDEFVMVLTVQGDLYGFGWNHYGQIDCGHEMVAHKQYYDDMKHITRPHRVMQGVKMVSCGEHYTAALCQDGMVWCWGKMFLASKGYKKGFYQGTPVKMDILARDERIVQIDCGSSFCLALTDHNQLYLHGNTYSCEEVNSAFLKEQTELPLLIDLKVRSVTAVNRGYLVLGINGSVHHFYYGVESNGKAIHYEPIELDEPVEAVVYDGSSVYFKLQLSVILVWRKIVKASYLNDWSKEYEMIRTNLTSLADVCSLYGEGAVTPGLTILSKHAISQLPTIKHFNDPSTSNLTICFGRKSIYLDKQIALQYLPSEAYRYAINGYCFTTFYQKYSYVVWFTFIRYILADTFSIQLEWANQLLSLATESKAVHLRDLCLHLIVKHLPVEARVYPWEWQSQTIMIHFPESVTMANSGFYYQLAEEDNNQVMQKQIRQLVATQSLSTALKVLDHLRSLSFDDNPTDPLPEQYLQCMSQNFDRRGLVCLLHHSELSPVAVRYLATTMTRGNCLFRFRLATNVNNDALREEVVKFVANLDDIFSFFNTTSFKQANSELIKDLLIHATELRNETHLAVYPKRKTGDYYNENEDVDEFTGSVLKCFRVEVESSLHKENLSSSSALSLQSIPLDYSMS